MTNSLAMPVDETQGRYPVGDIPHTFIRVYPNQIPEFWGRIKTSLIEAMPTSALITEAGLTSILAKLQEGLMECWLIVKEPEDNPSVVGIVITTIVEDIGTKTRNLFIYSVNSFGFITTSLWKDIAEALTSIARNNNCVAILGESSDQRILELVEVAGGNIETRLIRIIVEEI